MNGGRLPETPRERMWYFGIGSGVWMTMFLIGVFGWVSFWISIGCGVIVAVDSWAVNTGREGIDDVEGTGGGNEPVDKRTAGILWAKFVTSTVIVTLIIFGEHASEFDVPALMPIYHIVTIWWVKGIGWIIVAVLAPMMLRWLAKLYVAYRAADE